MIIDRAKELAEDYGYRLVADEGWSWNLYYLNAHGIKEYIDTLHQKQIQHMDEDDFVEFYLQ